MKLTSLSIIAAGIIIISSCGRTTRFPVSSYAPAADITAKTKMDKNNNRVITVTAKNLADAQRIEDGSVYVLWMETKNNEIKNLGQLQNKNAQTATITTVTPFEPNELFITLEPTGSVSTPSGTEISRSEVIDPYEDETAPRDIETAPRDTDDDFRRNESTDPFRNPSDTTRMK